MFFKEPATKHSLRKKSPKHSLGGQSLWILLTLEAQSAGSEITPPGMHGFIWMHGCEAFRSQVDGDDGDDDDDDDGDDDGGGGDGGDGGNADGDDGDGDDDDDEGGGGGGGGGAGDGGGGGGGIRWY